LSFGLEHSRPRQRKLQAGAGEEASFVALMEHIRDIRCDSPNPFEPGSMYEFP
jgi:hypothetical protein